jgi:hypothetical protein
VQDGGGQVEAALGDAGGDAFDGSAVVQFGVELTRKIKPSATGSAVSPTAGR